MKKLFLLLAIFCILNANAQNYLISFAAAGATGTVETVTVYNLTAKTTLDLNGTDILRLTTTTNIPSERNHQQAEIKIYPNPVSESSVIEVFPPISGDAVISIYDLTGKRIAQSNSYLENSVQQFLLSGVDKGFYTVIVEGKNYRYSAKLVGTGANGSVKIEKTASNVQKPDSKITTDASKGIAETKDMAYTAGDLLKITGKSGNYTTIVMDVPTTDKTITFTFVECKDGDNNYYPVVVIGTQTWMAKNLKTTKYGSGTSITQVSTDTDWDALDVSSKAYCYYNDDPGNADLYGALYTWAAAMNGALSSEASPSGVQGVCPTGWHMPSRAEVTTLFETVAYNGGKLKEEGFTHWSTYETYTGGSNTTGFTALPTGGRNANGGLCVNLHLSTSFWSTTEVSGSESYARVRVLLNTNSTFLESSAGKPTGLSVRCIKD